MLTVGCVWLGWQVEKARKRGRAIDAVVEARGEVLYEDNDDEPLLSRFASRNGDDHFWLDLKGVPVWISLNERLDSTISMQLSHVYNIKELDVCIPVESDLKFLEGVRGTCVITLHGTEAIGDAAIERLQEKIPDSEITFYVVRR